MRSLKVKTRKTINRIRKWSLRTLKMEIRIHKARRIQISLKMISMVRIKNQKKWKKKVLIKMIDVINFKDLPIYDV